MVVAGLVIQRTAQCGSFKERGNLGGLQAPSSKLEHYAGSGSLESPGRHGYSSFLVASPGRTRARVLNGNVYSIPLIMFSGGK